MKTIGIMRKWPVSSFKETKEGIRIKEDETEEDRAPSINIVYNGEVLDLQLDALARKTGQD